MLCGLRFPSHFFRDASVVTLSISVTCVTVVCYVVLGWCVTVCGWRYVVGDGVRVTRGGMTIRAWWCVGDGMWVTAWADSAWVTLWLWRCVGDGALAYTVELELDSEVGKWIAHVSVLYNTVSTDVTSRHGDDTPIKLYVTQRFLLRFHNTFRYIKLRYGALRWCVTGVRYGALR